MEAKKHVALVKEYCGVFAVCWLILVFFSNQAVRAQDVLDADKNKSTEKSQPFFAYATSEQSLKDRFLNPPADCRPLRMLLWQTDPNAVDQMLKNDGFLGYGGYVSCVAMPLDANNWQVFLRSIKEAKKNGAALWLYDEYNMGYPSGNAQGMVLAGHPELEMTDLFFDSTGTLWQTSRFPPWTALNLPPGDLVMAKAFPIIKGVIDLNSTQSIDLTPNIHNGRIKWTLPYGQQELLAPFDSRQVWQMVAVTKAFQSQVNRGSSDTLSSLLSRESTDRFIEITYEKYLAKIGNDIGKYFDIVITDEPTLCAMKTFYPKVPWSPNFLEEFSKRRGYDIKPLLPALFVRYSDFENYGNIGKKVRHDYWLTVTELTVENYFVPRQDWCSKYGMQLCQQPFMEESMMDNVAAHGDFFRCFRKTGVPSIDILTSTPEANGLVWDNQQPRKVPWIPARIAASVADLCNQRIVMCEQSDFVQNFSDHAKVSEPEIRGSYNRSLRSGINAFMTYYSYAGLSQERIQAIHNWVGRCCTMLRGGHQVTDIAVVYPIESMWSRCTATLGRPCYDTATEEMNKFQNMFNGISDILYSADRDFTYIDSIALNDAVVENGELVHGNLRWKVIILPSVDTLPLAAWKKLEKFWESGGVVISVSELPANSEADFPSEYVSTLGQRMFAFSNSGKKTLGRTSFYIPVGSESGLATILDSIVERDVKTTGTGGALRSVHKRIDGHEVYFIINDTSTPWHGKISLGATGSGERLDPKTGEIKVIPEGKDISLELDAYDGIFFRFPSPK